MLDVGTRYKSIRMDFVILPSINLLFLFAEIIVRLSDDVWNIEMIKAFWDGAL